MTSLSWHLDDAQELSSLYPYTFHKPSQKVVSLLKPGNQAKLIFRFESSDPEAPQAERMWVEITEVLGDHFVGYLDNDPVHINDLKYKDEILFNEKHIIATDLDDPVPSITDKYIKRCFVTNNVLYDGDSVGYLYRKKPDQEDDSGWRFTRGDETDEYMDDSGNCSYVSLGAVLTVDDSFVKLLDRDADVAFSRNDESHFVELD